MGRINQQHCGRLQSIIINDLMRTGIKHFLLHFQSFQRRFQRKTHFPALEWRALCRHFRSPKAPANSHLSSRALTLSAFQELRCYLLWFFVCCNSSQRRKIHENLFQSSFVVRQDSENFSCAEDSLTIFSLFHHKNWH